MLARSYNFPFNLTIGPLIGAIAAGCTAVIKPSEVSSANAALMQHIIETYLDPEAYVCVQGAVPETTKLLEEKWDKIFYTGGATVGKIIAKKAAETLTPVTLELGGRNPAFIPKSANLRLAARRLLWGKCLNAGQVCISHNYTLVDKDVFPAYIEEVKKAMKEFFPNGVKASPDYSRIVNNRHFHRIKAMLDNSNGKILIGGTMDESQNFIEPTLIQVYDVEDSLMKDENFGPLMPVMAVDGLDEMIRIANTVHSTPLANYPFGSKKDYTKSM
jgi:beta-apo-4'-carotenal oxygenase